ncbi:alpha/beta hydrolase [Verrucomicrobiales bacterium]|nr:alpha/beta hydrolase [Verrucomicrobiales bacterium]
MKTTLCALGVALTLILNSYSETFKLWPEGEGGSGAENVTLTLHRAKTETKETKTSAVIICPGGGYGTCVMSYEGNDVGKWFASKGVTAFVLKYRVSPHRHPLPGDDVRKAISRIRTDASSYQIDPKKIGVMGFSAGGHLAATAGTQFSNELERPDFMILAYPVISMAKGVTHEGSKMNLLGKNAGKELLEKMSLENQVTAEVPPAFIFHTDQDRPVPAENSLRFVSSLRRAGVGCEFHLFREGGHGVGLGRHKGSKKWPGLLEDWLTRSGYIH